MIYKNVTIVSSSILKYHLTIIRDKKSSKMNFQHSMRVISQILFLEAAKGLELKEFKIETPITETDGYIVKKKICLVPILRAGLAMIDGIESIYSEAIIGMIGVKRDEESLNAIHYYENLPNNLQNYNVFLLDPMLATGVSAKFALKKLYEKNANPIFLNIISVDKGVKELTSNFPNLKIYTSSIDQELNENAYIVPGLGDAGDRYFGI